MWKRIFAMILAIFYLVNGLVLHVHATSSYSVKRVVSKGEYETLYTANSYNDALSYYEENQDIGNYAIFKDDTIVKVKYGVVVFAEGKGCNYTVNYTNATNQQSGYTNGCYGADGLYLDTNSNASKVLFQLSNVLGWAKMSDVTIYPYEEFTTFSSYFVKDGHLYHQIKTKMHSDLYSSTLDLGEEPTYLKEDMIYYSYDGKYFYNSFYEMRDDVYSSSHNNAINAFQPYYNYYQYVSNRSLTQYSEEELSYYITNILGIDSAMTTFYDKNKDSISEILNQSQYYNHASALLQYQYQYGANALMILAISSNETASGRSGLAFYRNNLFGHAAYDSNVEANASRYNSVTSSIASHAKNYISNNYSNPKKFMYHGSFFGDKGSGMNVSYASDPYWGEKAAQYYMRIDTQLGGKDKNAYAIGIKSNSKDIPVYSLPSIYSAPLYTTGPNWDYSFILLDKIEMQDSSWYKVQIDPALNEQRESTGIYYYNFAEMVGYIRQSDVQYVLNEEKIGSLSFDTSIYDAKEGKFSDGSTVQEITHLSNSPLTITPPILENAIFQGFKEVSPHYYEAVYKPVSLCWIEGDYQDTYTIGESLNLKNMTLVVLYEDGTKESIPVTTSMVSTMRFEEEGAKKFTISYQGVSTQVNVLVVQRDSTLAKYVSDQFNTFAQLHPLETELTEEEQKFFLTLVENCKQYGVIFSNDEIRYIDTMLQELYQTKLQVKIEKNPFDISFSGISFLVPFNEIEDSRFPSTLHVNTKKLDANMANKFQTIIEGNGWHYYQAFEVEMKHNKEAIDMANNYVLSIAKPTDHDLSQMYILLAEKDGDIYRFYGKQTDSRIVFQTQGFTKFAIAYQNTNNIYSEEDIAEVYRMDNNGYDVATRFITIGTIIAIIILIGMGCIFVYLHTPVKKRKHQEEEVPIRLSNVELEDQKTNE